MSDEIVPKGSKIIIRDRLKMETIYERLSHVSREMDMPRIMKYLIIGICLGVVPLFVLSFNLIEKNFNKGFLKSHAL